MSLTKTPICKFGEKIINFSLKSTDNKNIKLSDIKGSAGTQIIFMCNHCPYVVGSINRINKAAAKAEELGMGFVGINSNDAAVYAEDSFDNMVKFAKANDFREINYLIDETQEIARKYGAVCTPDFFGYNKDLKLQYRGRFRELKDLKPILSGDSDLKIAMKMISKTQVGPKEQTPSMGCNIKWFN